MPIIASATLSDAGGSTYNQDRSSVTTTATTHQVAVLDGHGTLGEESADWAVSSLTADADVDPLAAFAAADAAIRDGFRKHLHTKAMGFLVEDGGFYHLHANGLRGAPIRGGTTATLLRVDKATGALTVANVGDSTAVVFDSDTDPGQVLTDDHSPLSVVEWNRVHASHPATEFFFHGRGQFRPVFLDGSPNPAGGFYHADVRGSWAAYLTAADNSEQLAMTRALGDFNLKRHGVIAVPAVRTVEPLAEGVRAIVTATDGLWDAVHYHEARDIVRRADLLGNATAATSVLMGYGRSRARGLFGWEYDNITVSVTYVS